MHRDAMGDGVSEVVDPESQVACLGRAAGGAVLTRGGGHMNEYGKYNGIPERLELAFMVYT